MLDNLVGSLDLAKVKNSGKGKVLMQAMYGVKVETVFICRVFTVAFSGSSKKLSDLNVADIHSWALHFRRLQNLVNEEIRDGVDTVEIEWLLKTVEELRAGIEKLSQGNDLLAKGVDGFFEAVMTSRDTLLSSVRFDKTVNDRSPGRNRDMQLVH
ncbi:Protein BPS1, chloroplastic [Glycine soja]|uniref:Protein BPS1, chloroplastic n=1 Tax=Glycine soja TaxID=3848 RepID=A0A0B2RVF2_GLYSO|nr:Protein BPS1, chloroplastic [Glycine soja]